MRNPSGERLAARVSDTGSSPFVLLVHGFTASKDSNFFPALFERLRASVSVVAMDLSAHGESEGRFSDMTIPKLEADIETVIEEHARARPIVIVGHSMGGALAYRLAARRDDVVGLVLLAPGFEVRSGFLSRLEVRAIERGEVSFTDGFGRERTVSGAFFESRRHDALDLAGDVRSPTFIICAELDYTISNDRCAQVAEALEDARFELIEGVGHTFDDTDARIGPLIEAFLSSVDSG